MEGSGKACWPYLKSNGVEFSVLGISVKGLLEALQIDEALAHIDTGFDGFLLLSEEKYRRIGLHLSELSRRYWPEGETVTGELLKLRRALAIIQVPKLGLNFEGYVDTFHGSTENLAGLRLIEGLKLLLDGPARLVASQYKRGPAKF
ncbi:MAG: hypothetical protein QXE79_05805 [Candidatus Bathyarchaeia archaeon]